MPKLIPELEEKILKTGESLFTEEGYGDVSMRRLARELDIALGTLYNYFPNKSALLRAVMDKSWSVTFSSLDRFFREESLSQDETLRRALEIVYGGIRTRGGLAVKALADRHENILSLTREEDELPRSLAHHLAPLGGVFAGPRALRMSLTLLASMRIFLFPGHTEREKDGEEGDIAFLADLVEAAGRDLASRENGCGQN